MTGPSDDDPVPRIPRRLGATLPMHEIVRIVMVAALLVAVVVLQKPCARSVSRFVTSFGPIDAGVAPSDASPSGAVTPPGVRLRTDMTPAEIEAAIRGARTDAGAARDAGVDAR